MSQDKSLFSPSALGETRVAPPLRVLIAEDDRDAAASLEALVQDEGHSTRCVYRGREVLGAVKDFGADVVLLDIGMPGITGYDIARAQYESSIHQVDVAKASLDRAKEELAKHVAN